MDAVECKKISERWVLVRCWCNWRALNDWLRPSILSRHSNNGVKGLSDVAPVTGDTW